ncbi:MAG: DJ-1/PfpI family protein [Methylococcaceae bacterium]|nr:DJ-1/PfpI family protein [Methylococcaceae bacterium]
MRYNLQFKSALIRIFLALFFSLTSFNSHAFNAEESSRSTSAKHDVANGGRNNRHITSMDELMSLKPNPNVTVNGVGIYAYDGMFSLDAMGPYQVFKSAGLNPFLIAKKKGNITMSNGLTIAVNKSIDEVNQLDVLLIPGGADGTARQTIDPEVINWIKKIDQTSIYTTSVCTGAWILGAAGLLEGKEATTHWYRAEEMLTKYGADFEQKRWVRDGKYWTSAGVTAGLDMSLALVNHLFGKEYTQAVMLDLEYDPKPPIQGGTPEKSRPIIAQLMKDMYDFFLLNFVTCPDNTPGACLSN